MAGAVPASTISATAGAGPAPIADNDGQRPAGRGGRSPPAARAILMDNPALP